MEPGGNPLALGFFFLLLGGALVSFWRLNKYRPYRLVPGYWHRNLFPAPAGFLLIFTATAGLYVMLPALNLGTYVLFGWLVTGAGILLPYLFVPRGTTLRSTVPRPIHTFSLLLFFTGVIPFVWAGILAGLDYFDKGGEWSTVAWIAAAIVAASLFAWFYNKGKTEQEIVASAPAQAVKAAGIYWALWASVAFGILIILFVLHFVFGII
jgi:hypothetical protein